MQNSETAMTDIGNDGRNLLLGLAWVGKATTEQIHRLWFPDYSSTGIRKHLRRLAAQGYVSSTMWARVQKKAGRNERRAPPRRQSTLWALTNKGHALIREHDQYPPSVPTDRGRRMYEHDTMTTEILVRILELGRAGANGSPVISGIYVEHEVRLDPANRRPIIDALLILRGGASDALVCYDELDMVPWTRDPRTPDERVRRYAIENDRNSEPISVIRGKAEASMAASTEGWKERYGGLPIVLWLVPTERRLQAILQAWREVWPGGFWLMTTDDWLADDRWLEYRSGTVRERTLFGATPAMAAA